MYVFNRWCDEKTNGTLHIVMLDMDTVCLLWQDIDQYLSTENRKETDVVNVRLENIKLKNKLKKKEHQLKSKVRSTKTWQTCSDKYESNMKLKVLSHECLGIEMCLTQDKIENPMSGLFEWPDSMSELHNDTPQVCRMWCIITG